MAYGGLGAGRVLATREKGTGGLFVGIRGVWQRTTMVLSERLQFVPALPVSS